MTGPPDQIPLCALDLSEVEEKCVAEAMHDRWISGSGRFVAEFERTLGERVHREHVVAVANGTLAIELALRALRIGPGDEVVIPALTFAAPAMSVAAVGAEVVLADVTLETWTLDPVAAARAVTPRTKAVVAVDLLGHPVDYDAVTELGVPVVQDAAQAHGAVYKGQPVGAQGMVSAFSFHANKVVSTGEGGAVCTDDPELAAMMRLIANHGMTPEEPYVHRVLGRNFRMTNLAAAVGVGQVRRWDELVAARARIGDRYRDLLPPDFAGPGRATWAGPACWLHTIRVPHRAAVLDRLRAAGIDARRIWPPLDQQPVFAHLAGNFPVAHAIADAALWLPTHAHMSDDQIRFIADTVVAACRERASHHA
jgi:perosamine synthetase